MNYTLGCRTNLTIATSILSHTVRIKKLTTSGNKVHICTIISPLIIVHIIYANAHRGYMSLPLAQFLQWAESRRAIMLLHHCATALFLCMFIPISLLIGLLLYVHLARKLNRPISQESNQTSNWTLEIAPLNSPVSVHSYKKDSIMPESIRTNVLMNISRFVVAQI